MSGHLDYRIDTPATCATSYPRALDTNAPALVPSQMKAMAESGATPGKGITIRRSDREGTGKTWWWIGGDTKPVKDILSLAGARWSRRRRQWYYIGETLPDSIRALSTPDLSSIPPAETAPHCIAAPIFWALRFAPLPSVSILAMSCFPRPLHSSAMSRFEARAAMRHNVSSSRLVRGSTVSPIQC